MRASSIAPVDSDARQPEFVTTNSYYLRSRRIFDASWWRLDLALLCVSLLGTTLYWGDRMHEPRFVDVLALRISLVNCLFALGCIWFWRMTLTSVRFDPGSKASSSTKVFVDFAFRITLCASLAAAAVWLRHPSKASLLELVTFWFTSLLLTAIGRLLIIGFFVHSSLREKGDRRVIIVGTGSRAQKVAEEIRCHPRWRYRILGFVDTQPQFESENYLGRTDELEAILMRQVVDAVIIALPVKSRYDDIQSAIAACERMGVQSEYSTDLYATKIAKRRSEDAQEPGTIVLHMVHNDSRMYLKRAIDIVGAIVGLVVFAVPMILVAVAVKCTSEGQVIFRQQRLGLKKRIFSMYKFRSMVVDAEKQQAHLEHLNEAGGPVFKIRKDPRTTSVGHFIRKTSLDELPQLINVLRGDMSLVGPRPLPMRDVDRFSEAWLMRRFSVRPGLTGLWQVSGRSGTSFTHWIKLDLEYIDAWSLVLDFKILARTVPAVLKREGAA